MSSQYLSLLGRVCEWVDVELLLCVSVGLRSNKSCRQEEHRDSGGNDVGARGVSLIYTHSF